MIYSSVTDMGVSSLYASLLNDRAGEASKEAPASGNMTKFREISMLNRRNSVFIRFDVI